MDCRAFRNSFSDFLDGALGAAVSVRCRRHLEACEACRRFDAAYRAGVATLRRLDPPCPARDFSVRVLHRVRRERYLPILAGGYGLAAALLTITLVGVITVDIRERRQAAVPAASRIADAVPAPPAEPEDGLDLITVQVRDVTVDPFSGDPYAVVPIAEPEPSPRYRFEVPAVWSGR
jgi:predicted anti-sigma-YlaC factor YlaD